CQHGPGHGVAGRRRGAGGMIWRGRGGDVREIGRRPHPRPPPSFRSVPVGSWLGRDSRPGQGMYDDGCERALAPAPVPGQNASARAAYTASDREVKWKSRTLSGGTYTAVLSPPDSLGEIRTGRPIISMLLSMKMGDSFQRRFLTGCVTRPFSIRHVLSL